MIDIIPTCPRYAVFILVGTKGGQVFVWYPPGVKPTGMAARIG